MNNLEARAISKIVSENSHAEVLSTAAAEMRRAIIKLMTAISEEDMGKCGVLAKSMEIDVNLIMAVAEDMSPTIKG